MSIAKWLAYSLESIAAALVYAVVVIVSIWLAPSAIYHSIFWPSAGLALALVALRGNFHTISLLLGGVLAYGIIYVSARHESVAWLLLMHVVMAPVQAYFGARWLKRYCGDDLWLFADLTRLIRFIAVAVVPAAINAFVVTGIVLINDIALPASWQVAFISTFMANAAGVVIITPCLLVVGTRNELANMSRKIQVIVPVIGLFAVASLCYSVLYHQLMREADRSHDSALVAQGQAIEERIRLVYQQLQTLRFLLSGAVDHQLNGDFVERFNRAAQSTMLAQRAVINDPPYYALAVVQLDNDAPKNFPIPLSGNVAGVRLAPAAAGNYSVAKVYPTSAFNAIVGLPLANDDLTLRLLQATATRTSIRTLPNLDLVRTQAGSFIAILLHQLHPDTPERLLGALVDVSNLVFHSGAYYREPQVRFAIEDVLSGRLLYQSQLAKEFDSESARVYRHLVTFGDRNWRISAEYNEDWLEQRLQSELLPASFAALILIAIFTLLILSALVSAQTLQQTVVNTTRNLNDESRFLDTVFDNLPLIIFIKDAKTRRYLRVNRYTEQLLGIRPDWYQGKTVFDLFSPEAAKARDLSDEQALLTGKVVDAGEEVIESPQGDRIIYTRKTVIEDAAGDARYILGISEDITDAKAQKRTIQSLVQLLPLSLLVVTHEGHVIFFNDTARKLFGLNADFTSLTNLLPNNDIATVLSLINDAPLDARPMLINTQIMRDNAESISLEVSFTKTLWQGDERVMVIITDISERVHAQKSLRDSEKQLHLLMANLGEGVLGVDPLGNITYANLAACRTLGFHDPEQLLGLSFYQTILVTAENDGDPVFKACSLGQVTRCAHAKFFQRMDSKVAVEYVCTPVLTDTAKNIGAVIVFSNIQERLEYQSHLQRRNELIELGLDASGLGSWEWHIPSAKVIWSPNLYKILEMPEGGFSGNARDALEVVYADDREQIYLIDEYARNSLEVTDFCCRLTKLNGSVIWVTGKYRYFTDENNQIIRARGVLWDSTEETLMAQDIRDKTEALKRSNKELDDFAHIASHDLKEPLRGISNYATFLEEDYTSLLDDEGQGMLKSIVRLTGHMERLINDLLSYSRLGRTEMAVQEVAVDALVMQVVDSLGPVLEANNAAVAYRTPMPRIQCDSVRIKEVFRNLITNAFKYNESDSKEIIISAKQQSSGYEFSVSDNGIGIAPEYQDKVFEVFKRLHGSSEYGGGSGIGLSIVHKVVTQHKGKLWVKSTKDVGTTIFFTIPALDENV